MDETAFNFSLLFLDVYFNNVYTFIIHFQFFSIVSCLKHFLESFTLHRFQFFSIVSTQYGESVKFTVIKDFQFFSIVSLSQEKLRWFTAQVSFNFSLLFLPVWWSTEAVGWNKLSIFLYCFGSGHRGFAPSIIYVKLSIFLYCFSPSTGAYTRPRQRLFQFFSIVSFIRRTAQVLRNISAFNFSLLFHKQHVIALL